MYKILTFLSLALIVPLKSFSVELPENCRRGAPQKEAIDVFRCYVARARVEREFVKKRNTGFYLVKYLKRENSPEVKAKVVRTFTAEELKFDVVEKDLDSDGNLKRALLKVLEGEQSLYSKFLANPDRLEISEKNYRVKFLAKDTVEGRAIYKFAIDGKRKEMELTRSILSIDAETFLPVSNVGSPKKSPSFFVRGTRFNQKYDSKACLSRDVSKVFEAKVPGFGHFGFEIVYSNQVDEIDPNTSSYFEEWCSYTPNLNESSARQVRPVVSATKS